MHEAVSDILVERARDADRMGGMLALSVAAHAALLTAIVFMPAHWRSGSLPSQVTPMMITLSGGSGPEAGGMTPIAGRPVQVETPTETKAAVAPPAEKPPEMVAPEVKAKPASKTPKVEKSVDKSAARKPNTGPEVKAGSARVETGGAPVEFGGLTRPSGGGPPTNSAYTDYANFCCPGYLAQMTELIKRNWNQNQGATGQVLVKFTIRRDGLLTDVQIEKPSNVPLLDLESQRALMKTRTLPPLPREFTENSLTVHLIFDYHR